MKLITFEKNRIISWGALMDDQVLDLGAARLAPSLLAWIESGQQLNESSLAQPVQSPLADVRLLAPIPRPPKVVGIGLNYMDHIREQNAKVPERPILFAKFASSVIGPHQSIRFDTALSQQVDFEAELAVVIGKTARRVPPEESLRYVFGYTCLNDVSARDLQFADRQWVRAKSLDTFCPLGPWIVTADEIPDPQNLSIRCRVSGELLQDSNTSEMIFSVAELISFISQSFTLEPGDMIATGTPNGVGVFREPKRFLQAGDVVQVEIDGIGVLENPVEVDSTV